MFVPRTCSWQLTILMSQSTCMDDEAAHYRLQVGCPRLSNVVQSKIMIHNLYLCVTMMLLMPLMP